MNDTYNNASKAGQGFMMSFDSISVEHGPQRAKDLVAGAGDLANHAGVAVSGLTAAVAKGPSQGQGRN